MENIAVRVMSAYEKATNNSLSIQYYDSNDEIDKVVKSKTYMEHTICFAIGWNTYDPAKKQYDIDIRIAFASIVSTGTDQVTN